MSSEKDPIQSQAEHMAETMPTPNVPNAVLRKAWAQREIEVWRKYIPEYIVELGITDPVVPMWLPDGCELISVSEKKTPMKNEIAASFSLDGKEIIYKVDMYDGEPAHQFYRDDTHYETLEQDGTIFHVTRNIDQWTVIWSKGHIECSIFIDCNEDVLKKILSSIYVMEE